MRRPLARQHAVGRTAPAAASSDRADLRQWQGVAYGPPDARGNPNVDVAGYAAAMKSSITVAVVCAVFFCAGPALAQVSVKPLLTQPAEQIAITQGFRDWIGITLAGPMVVSGAPNAKGGLYAIDAATRAVKWTFRPGVPASPMVSTQASVVGNTVIARFGNWEGALLIGVSLVTGKELWRAPADVPMDKLALGDGLAFVLLKAQDTDRRGLRVLSAVDTQTGKERWQATFKTETVTAPVFADGTVYIGVAGVDGSIVALDAKAGQERWRYRLTHDFPTSLLAIDSGVYGGDNWLYGVSRETGRELWRPTELRRTVDDKPQLFRIRGLLDAGDTLIAPIKGNRYSAIVGFDKGSGALVWERPVGERLSRVALALAGKVLYFQEQLEPTVSGEPGGPYSLRAMDLSTREILWSYSRAGRENWAFGGLTPIDGGLWVTHYATLLKLK